MPVNNIAGNSLLLREVPHLHCIQPLPMHSALDSRIIVFAAGAFKQQSRRRYAANGFAFVLHVPPHARSSRTLASHAPWTVEIYGE